MVFFICNILQRPMLSFLFNIIIPPSLPIHTLHSTFYILHSLLHRTIPSGPFSRIARETLTGCKPTAYMTTWPWTHNLPHYARSSYAHMDVVALVSSPMGASIPPTLLTRSTHFVPRTQPWHLQPWTEKQGTRRLTPCRRCCCCSLTRCFCC